ncbi:acetyltransferase (gnaT) family [Caudoviricetes sp.]|nr:acetyltransferase (gnaT) family [Caudoviricetes sp.]UOF79640.1 acetyltransferase (gnaT) family [Caudoviricetes sp.]UOF79826.1 acetyltransferase (gnaT) family [Bacteriophage sp.]UOF81311.1 acetyltransferase (gnaT) family [Caudoviricetes sp.]
MVRYWTAVEASQAGRIFAVFDGTQLAGCLGCIVSPDFATDALAADEIFFYIDRPYRGSRAAYLLLSEYLMYAQDRGARVARLSHFIDDAATVGRIYCRYGFGPINTVYVKELSWDGQLQP